MMNKSVTVPAMSELGGERKMQWQTGLGLEKGIEKFTYQYNYSQIGNGAFSGSQSKTTEVIYSRFGPQWGLESNLYNYDFPEAVQILGPNDAILINAAAHYRPQNGHNLEKALTFIAEQSMSANATVFYMEPTPEDWPTTNSHWARGLYGSAQCEPA